ncbi:MAG: C10 family peptidase, partial [Candidatus Delongbacteria bacterium]|nr:C10 family peptidase [Candidatus Delongbacteria bacterium]
MKKLLLSVFATALVLSAAFVPVDRAKTVAENQYKQYCADANTKGADIINVVENRYEGEVTWYAFEFDKGFVIVSADDAVRPILGYSDHGNVPKADKLGGQNFKEWFGNYDKQIAYMRANNVVDKVGQQSWKDIENNVFASSKAGIVVDRLLLSQWDQVWPWNDDCPVKGDDGAFCYVGCVATSMSMILRYHKWPNVGVGSASYSWNNDVTTVTLSANFTTHTWDYDLMPEVLGMDYGLYPEYWESNDFTQADVDELALQSYWVALSVNMDFGDSADGGSSAYCSDSDNAFIDHWKGTSTYASFSTPPAGGVDASYATIIAQLDAKKPWQWAGGVHSFNLDGYRNDYWYHFNWGWGGSYDGWYHRSSLIPGGIGSGGGDGDFTAGQLGITYAPTTNPFTAWPMTTVNGSVANGEDVTVTWASQTGATGYELYRTKDKQGVPTLLTTTTSLSYVDNDLSVGEYSYHVIVTYATGNSHNSNSYSTTIATVGNFKYPTALGAKATGRTSIDLTWVKPYTGITWLSTGWETGDVGTWNLTRASYPFASTINNKNWVTEAAGNNWVVADETFFADAAYIHDGTYAAQIGYTFDDNLVKLRWLYSPTITLGAGGTWEFWAWYCNYSTGSGLWPTDIYYCFYKGDFTERTGIAIAANTTILEFWDGEVIVAENPETYGNNFYETQGSIDLTPINGQTGRIAFVYSYNDGFQMAIDDVVIGAPTGGIPEPTGYQVYKEGAWLADVSGPTNVAFSDTGFADGANSYYVRAVYPTGTSIPSIGAAATMDANPKPYDLIGSATKGSADLGWYVPYHNRPKWYCYYDVNKSVTTIDILDEPVLHRRVEWKSDAGYYYPVTIDSISAIFYQWEGTTWESDQFKFVVQACGGYAPGGGMLPDTILWESGLLTAVSCQEYKVGLPTPITRTSRGWAVEVAPQGLTTGDPGNLAGLSPDGEVHSWTYNLAEDSYRYYMI